MKLFISVLLISIAIPFLSHAGVASYGTIYDFNTDSVIIRYRNIESDKFFLCTIQTFVCEQKNEEPALPYGTASPEIQKDPFRQLLRQRGSFVQISANRTFGAYYSASRVASGSKRNFVIVRESDRAEFKRSGETVYWDLLSEHPNLFAFSPDETKMIYIDDRNGPMTPYLVDLTKLSGSTFTGERIITRSYSVSDIIFTDSDTIYFIANRDNAEIWSLYKLTLSTSTLVKIAEDISFDEKLRKFGTMISFVKINSGSVDPMLYDTVTDTIKTWNGLPAFAAGVPMLKYTTGSWGGFGGVLMSPDAPSKTLIVWLHGGPYRQTGYLHHAYQSYAAYDFALEEARRAGAYVLKLSYPGSFGYGRPFAESIKNQVGLGDVDAVYRATLALQKQKGITNTYLAGNSYGGYLALRSLVAYVNTFSGAVSINGVTDWAALNERLQTSIFNIQFGGLPNKNTRARYDQASILSRIYRLTTQPVALLHGEVDNTIPVEQSRELADALVTTGKNTNLYVYPEEDHIYKIKETVRDMCINILETAGLRTEGRCVVE